MTRVIPSGLISVGFQKITTNSTATGLNTTCVAGQALLLSVEAQNARVTFDGSTPAASTGVLLTTTASPFYFDSVDASTLKIARAAAGCIVQVQAFKR